MNYTRPSLHNNRDSTKATVGVFTRQFRPQYATKNFVTFRPRYHVVRTPCSDWLANSRAQWGMQDGAGSARRGATKRAGPGSRSAGQFRYLVRAPRGRGPRARHNLPPLTDDDISGRANRRDGPGARRSAAAISAHVRSIILAAVYDGWPLITTTRYT